MQTKRSSRTLIKYVREYKSSNGCVDCGIKYHYSAMQFDHKEGREKEANINALMWRAGFDRVLSEIAKCDLVCANCHAFRTYKRQHNIDDKTTDIVLKLSDG